jgi:hypothetical protein
MELSLDWIHNLIYFNENDKIIVFNINQPEYGFIAIDGKGNKLNHISVNPLDSFIIYCVYNDKGTIMKALQDGSDQNQLYEEIDSYPISLSIDLLSRRVYWIDLHFSKLSSIDFEGKHYHKILQSEEIISQPFFMAIFGEKIYWSNSFDHKIFEIDKLGLNATKINYWLKSDKDEKFQAIEIIDASLQPNSTNRCENAQCSHLCIPISINQYRCVCPQIKFHDDNYQKMCIESVII